MTMKEKKQLLLLEKRRYELEEKISFIEKYKLFRNYSIQKIIGYIEMANVKININKKVLIPRYETEELIYHAIDFIKKNKYQNILDLGCGSGFIGIAIKKNISEFQINVTQSDVDRNAIKQTTENNKLNNINNKIIKSNLFENIGNKFDLIVSNPPYLMFSEKKQMSKSVLKYEPHIALFANDNGMEFYKQIELNLNKYLNKNGMILYEINPLNSKWFKNNNYSIIKDINNKERFAFKKI